MEKNESIAHRDGEDKKEIKVYENTLSDTANMILIPYCVEGTEILSESATMMKMIPSQAVDTMETFTKDWGNERTD